MKVRRAVGIALLALAGSGAYVIFTISGSRTPASREGSARRGIIIISDTVDPHDAPAVREGTLDGATVGGRLRVATTRGLYAPGADRVARFGDAEVTAMAVHRGRIVLGTRDGTVTFVEDRAKVARLSGFTEITDLASDGARLYVATISGLVVWDGEHASVRIDDAITAMTAGPDGVAIGTSVGELWVARGGRVERLSARVEDRVTALAWEGRSLLVGTPFALVRVAQDRVSVLRRDLHVTALLVDGARVYIGTFDDGVVCIDERGRERRLIGREHVRRLRWIDGRPVAFGDGGAWDLSGPAASRLV
jgi:hypothetical protein